MGKILTKSTILPCQKTYIQDFKYASTILESWIKEYKNDPLAETTITGWKETCDNFLGNLNFMQGWHLPAFYPFYSYQCMASINCFFNTGWSIYPEKTSGKSKPSLQTQCSLHGNLPTSLGVQPNVSLSPSAYGIMNTNTSTSISSHKFGPLSFRSHLFPPGVESCQETENSRHTDKKEICGICSSRTSEDFIQP